MPDFAWFDTGEGRKVYRRISEPGGKRASLPCPRIVRPFASPVKSMADGRLYDDPHSLRQSYKAANNPQGIDYAEVGNEDLTRFTPPKRDRKADREAIERALNDVATGNAPPPLTELPV